MPEFVDFDGRGSRRNNDMQIFNYHCSHPFLPTSASLNRTLPLNTDLEFCDLAFLDAAVSKIRGFSSKISVSLLKSGVSGEKA
jgi:hypothetical protein